MGLIVRRASQRRIDAGRPVSEDLAEVVYSRTRIYELISASIRTSLNSGFTHAMLRSPPPVCRFSQENL